MSGQVSGKGSYTGTTKATFTILKAKNTLKVSGKTVKISKKKVAKKAQRTIKQPPGQ